MKGTIDSDLGAAVICLHTPASVASLLSLYGKEKEKKYQDQTEKHENQVALKAQELRPAPKLIDT
jgi:hypothetical protein